MTLRTEELLTTELQWLKIHLRLAALEQSGSRLSCRFEFPAHSSNQIICRIYFTDDDSNSMKSVSQEERLEIYEGWMALAMHIIQQACEHAELPVGFVWKPTVKLILHQDCGMGGAVVHETEKPFVWPGNS